MLDPPLLPPSSSISRPTPEQAACSMKHRRRTQDVLDTWSNTMQHAADQTSTDSSGRGDHFPAISW